MGNCLKTQLKESVANDNLPVFNKLIVEIKNAMASPAADSFYFNFWSPEGTDWSVSNGIHDNSENPIQVNSPAPTKSGRLNNVAGNTLTINNPYAQKMVQIGRDIMSDYAIVKGIASLNYCTNLQLVNLTENWGELDFTKLHNIVYYSYTASTGNPTVYGDKANIESLLANNPKLVSLRVTLPTIDKINITLLPSKLQIVAVRITGSVEDLPLTLQDVNLGFSDITGSLDAYVAKLRQGDAANGISSQTSGAIRTSWIWGCGATIKGQSCQEYLISKGITTNPGANTWLTWTASDLDIVTTNPGLTPITIDQIAANIQAGVYDD